GGPNTLKSAKIPAFAARTGMTVLHRTPTAANLELLLKTYGPLWYPAVNGGHGTPTSGHVVVITGTDGTDLEFHDPYPPGSGLAAQTFPITDFFGAYLPPVATPSPFLVLLKGSRPGP